MLLSERVRYPVKLPLAGASHARAHRRILSRATCRAKCSTDSHGNAKAVYGSLGVGALLDKCKQIKQAIGKLLVPTAFSLSLLLVPGTAGADEAFSVAYDDFIANRDTESLFTDDARLGMETLMRYGEYVEGLAEEEERCGPVCKENREVLESAWQVIAQEHFSYNGPFTQAEWAERLFHTLKAHGGLLPSKAQLYDAITYMVAALTDPYTQFLEPSAFRRAIRRPLPSEQVYLRAQYVGLGLELGGPAPGGGRVVLAPLAGSPAEAAGIQRGDTLLTIDGVPADQVPAEQLDRLMRGPAGSTATLEWLPSAWPPQPTTTSPTPLYASAPTSPSASSPPSPSSQGGSEWPGPGPHSGVPGSWQAAGFATGPRPGSVSGMGVGEEDGEGEGRRSGMPVGAVASASASAAAGGVTAGAGARAGGAVQAAAVAAGVGDGAGGGDASARHVSELERRDLPQPAVKVSEISLGPGSGGRWATYVRVLYWGKESPAGLAAALRRYEPLPGNMGYVIDLRNNPGGVFEDAIAASTLFLRSGDLVAATIRCEEELVDFNWRVGAMPADTFDPEELPGRLADKPVVLLVNRSTASASEVFAGALRDNGRAVMLGEQTFGKGVVQYYFPLRDGADGGLRVTVSKYRTPSGYDISTAGRGLIPDTVCSDHPRGDLPRDLSSADDCVAEAARLLARGRGTPGAQGEQWAWLQQQQR